MPIQRPRRIFRASAKSSAGLGGGVRPAVLVGLVGAMLVAGVMLFALPTDLFGRVPPLTGTLIAAPQDVAVVDGETLVLHETVVRLQGITAPSRGQSCRAADGSPTDCGVASANALAALVLGHDVACHLDGRDREGFPQAMCEAAGIGLNRALVLAGWARARGERQAFAADEAQARSAGRGLWHGGAF